MREMLGGTVDTLGPPPRLHVRQVVLVELVVIPEMIPEIVPRARRFPSEEFNVRLADVDVVDGGVGVQLLMPLLKKLILDALTLPSFLDAVIAHDLEDAEADVVAVAAAAGKRGQRDAEQLASHAALRALARIRDARRHRLLYARHLRALVVAAAVPRQLAYGGQA